MPCLIVAAAIVAWHLTVSCAPMASARHAKLHDRNRSQGEIARLSFHDFLLPCLRALPLICIKSCTL